jgi:hypothetical protein
MYIHFHIIARLSCFSVFFLGFIVSSNEATSIEKRTTSSIQIAFLASAIICTRPVNTYISDTGGMITKRKMNPNTKLVTTLMHSPEFAAPGPAVVRPAEQVWHFKEPPVNAEYVPIGQILHPLAPGPLEDVPGAHGVQEVLPGAAV